MEDFIEIGQLMNPGSFDSVMEAARKGDVASMFSLGAHYHKEGLLEKAIFWYEQAANRGSAPAHYELGLIFMEDHESSGHKQNYPLALRHFKSGATLGFAKSAYNAGLLLYEGFGTLDSVPDLSSAAAYFKLAIALAQKSGEQDVMTAAQNELNTINVDSVKEIPVIPNLVSPTQIMKNQQALAQEVDSNNSRQQELVEIKQKEEKFRNEMDKKLNDEKKEKQELQEQLQRENEQIRKEMKDTLSQKEKELESYQNQLESLQRREFSLQTNQAEFNKKQEEWQKEYDQNEKKLDKRSKENTRQLELINDQFANLFNEKEKINQERVAIMNERTALSTQIFSTHYLQKEEELNHREIELDERETTLLKEIEKYHYQKTELEKKAEQINKQLEFLKEEKSLSQWAAQIEQSQQALKQLEFKRNYIDKLKKEMRMLESKIKKMEEDVGAIKKSEEVRQDLLHKQNTILPSAIKVNLSHYRRQCEHLEQLLQDSQESLEFIENETWRKSITALLDRLKKNLETLTKQLKNSTNANLLRLVEGEWKKGKQMIQTEIASCVGLEPDLVAQPLIEDLQNCYDMIAPPLILQEKQKLLEACFQSVLKELAQVIIPNGQENKPIFISYSWFTYRQVKRVHQLAEDLRTAGLPVLLDIWHNKDGSVTRFTENVNKDKSSFVLVIGTPCMRDKWEHPRNKVLPLELEQIGVRMREEAGLEEKEKGVIKLLFDGTNETSYPDSLKPNAARIFTDSRCYPLPALELLDLIIDRLYARYFTQDTLKAAQLLREQFTPRYHEILEAATVEEIDSLKQAYGKNEIKKNNINNNSNDSASMPSVTPNARLFKPAPTGSQMQPTQQNTPIPLPKPEPSSLSGPPGISGQS